jgi:hypothetical protein
VQAVFHREVRDARARGFGERLAEPALALHVALERGPRGLEVARERVVACELLKAPLVDAPEQLDGVTVHLLPEVGVDANEELVRDR